MATLYILLRAQESHLFVRHVSPRDCVRDTEYAFCFVPDEKYVFMNLLCGEENAEDIRVCYKNKKNRVFVFCFCLLLILLFFVLTLKRLKNRTASFLCRLFVFLFLF